MSRSNKREVQGLLNANERQSNLQPIAEAATSRISLAPPTDEPNQTAEIHNPPVARPETPGAPTDEDIEAALEDARQSDPTGQNDRFYYNGYQSRENVTEASVAQPPVGEFLGEQRLYFHSADNTWRMFPPEFDFPEVSSENDNGEEEVIRQRKRDKLKRIGIALFKRVAALSSRRRFRRDGDA